MAFQTSSPAILFFRFAAGIGIGMELVVIDTYLSELVPKTSRGRAFAFNQLLSFLAVPVVALASFFLVPRSFWGIDGWRWVTLIGSTGAFLVFVVRRTLPESPRWLEQSGRHQEADRIMRQIEERVQRETGDKLAEPDTATPPYAASPLLQHSSTSNYSITPLGRIRGRGTTTRTRTKRLTAATLGTTKALVSDRD